MFFQIVRGKFKIKLAIDACAKKMRQRDSWKMRQREDRSTSFHISKVQLIKNTSFYILGVV